MKRRITPALRPWLGLLAAVFVLNAAVTFHNVWPTPWITTRWELSIEIALILLALAAVGEFFRQPRHWLVPGVTVLVLVLCVGRYAEVTAPALYGRPVNVYWDAQHLPRVAAMLAEVASPWQLALGAAGFVMFFAVLVSIVYWCVARVWEGVSTQTTRRALGAVAAGIVALYGASTLFDWSPRYRFSVPVTATYAQQAAFLREALAGDAQRELPIAPLASSDLQNVAGADVLMMFLESYGAVSYDSPEISAVVAPQRDALVQAAADSGRTVLSAFVQSPTFGGNSWLAHATFMSGFTVGEPAPYNLLLTQKRETLSSRFAAAGYRVIGLMPGLRNEWPEGAFYRFDAIYGERELAYQGPDFGWWRIPDQYTLAKFAAAELAVDERPPVFMFFPTINTHVPFRPTPPLQPDWSKLLTAAPYDRKATEESLAVPPEWTNLAPAYADTLAYTFAYLASFLQQRPSREFVLVLIGDHQPAASVSGRGARWDVPVHVITAREAVGAALRDDGFKTGIDLAPGAAPVGTMSDLTTMLLEAFDRGRRPVAPGYIPGSDSKPSGD
jgi:hypothetical protein